MDKEFQIFQKPVKDEDLPTICPHCEGKGGFHDLRDPICSTCPKESCQGDAKDKNSCNIVYKMCLHCKGTGIINCPNAKVIYYNYLDEYRRT